MNRIDARFNQLRQAGRSALIPYLAVGHPSLEATVPTLHALVDAGADLLELGVPFSDPMADGPVIQAACEHALTQGVGVAQVLACVSQFRQRDERTPIILMGYMNPVERYGKKPFVAAAAAAGVDGVLLVDLPLEESSDLDALLSQHDVHQIFLIAPTTSASRRQAICAKGRGFIYYVALKGVTGAAHLAADRVNQTVTELRAATKVPIGVGFGVKTAAEAAQLASQADAVVVGSALVSALDSAAGPDASAAQARAFLRPLREAMDAARGSIDNMVTVPS